jgi:serine protease Do
MKKQFLSLLALPFAVTFCMAQTDKAPQTKEEHHVFRSKDGKKKEITIDKDDSGKHEKMTIVIDGDNITINGKPMGDLKGKLKMLNDMDFDFNDMPGNNNMAIGPRMQQFKRFNFRNDNAQGNKALLGVKTENNEKGAKIAEVSKESAAEKAGLKSGDIITQVNGDKITDPQGLVESIGKLHPQDLVDITVLRDGKEKKFKAELGKNNQENNQSFNWDNNNGFNFQAPEMPERPETPGRQNFQRNFNFDFNDNSNRFFNRDEKPKFGFSIKDNENGDGAVITSIKDGSNASKAGLQVNDIVTEIDGNPTKSTDDLKGQLHNINDKSSVKMKVLRNGKTESINVNVPKRIKTADL